MALLLPSLSTCAGSMTSGERRLAERLQHKLEGDYLCWYNVPIGQRQQYPDFIVLHPRRGILVLEVKDWNLSTIQTIDRHQAVLITNNGLTKTANPLEQARVNALRIDTLLRNDPALRNPPDHPYAGKLIMPYGWGAVLTNITRKQFDDAGLHNVIEPSHVICKDEMTESAEPEDFQKRLWDMFKLSFPVVLSLPQIDRVRWNLFPELRISNQQGSFGLFDDNDQKKAVQIPDLIKVMDVQQEQLARSLGEGHRVIHGVAGSGKTMILGYRSIHLAAVLAKPILVLCYNVTLAARLKNLLHEKGVGAKVAVYNFHEWCRVMHSTYQVKLPPFNKDYDAGTAALVTSTVQAVDRGDIPRAQYGAVLIDEGHDFKPDWYRLVLQMVDPDTNSVLVLYDDAQSIYSKDKERKFSFASMGIQAKGRTTIMKLNYRNTLEILTVAKAFAKDLLDPVDADEDSAPTVAPESVGRRGPMPELIRCLSASDENAFVASQIVSEKAKGRDLSDIAVIIRNSSNAISISKELERAGIAHKVATNQEEKRTLFSGVPTVKVVTLHSSKGLEFGVTFIPRICQLPHSAEDLLEEARLLYVGMTRATERLVMSHFDETPLSRSLKDSVSAAEKLLGR